MHLRSCIYILLVSCILSFTVLSYEATTTLWFYLSDGTPTML